MILVVERCDGARTDLMAALIAFVSEAALVVARDHRNLETPTETVVK